MTIVPAKPAGLTVTLVPDATSPHLTTPSLSYESSDESLMNTEYAVTIKASAGGIENTIVLTLKVQSMCVGTDIHWAMPVPVMQSAKKTDADDAEDVVELNPAEDKRSYSSVLYGGAVGTGYARSTLDSSVAWMPTSADIAP